jgi:hypothetical protein
MAAQLSSREQPKVPSYYHASSLICVVGKDAPGVRLFLTKSLSCERLKHPYIEIDIQQPAIQSTKRIVIGEDNQSYRCLDPREACEQALSGVVVFDRYQEKNAKGKLETAGRFDLKFRGSETESGSFTVDCYSPCG